MPTNRQIQRAAALAESNTARAEAGARRRGGYTEEAIRTVRDREHAAWDRYRRG